MLVVDLCWKTGKWAENSRLDGNKFFNFSFWAQCCEACFSQVFYWSFCLLTLELSATPILFSNRHSLIETNSSFSKSCNMFFLQKYASFSSRFGPILNFTSEAKLSSKVKVLGSKRCHFAHFSSNPARVSPFKESVLV